MNMNIDINKTIKRIKMCIQYGNNIDSVDVQNLINTYRNLEADLYEANNRINDLLDIVKQKDEMIDLMIDEIYRIDWQSECGNSREAIKKYFEERCK